MIAGLKRGNIQIVVRRFMDRKKPCLMVEEDNVGIIVGTFRNDEMAELFMKTLEYVENGGDFEGKIK